MTAITIPFLDLRAGYLELKEELDSAYFRVMESGWYLLGVEISEFEKEFATYCGAAYGVGVANGLDALHLALRAVGVGPGDEVIVPANTYIASWLAVMYCGATPVPIEPDRYYTLDPDLLTSAITPKTRAIMPVHLYGLTADMDRINAIAAEQGVAIVEDAAQAHGATFTGRRAGAFGNVACYSFYPGKNLGAFGDAGAVVTDDPGVADRVRVLRNYGSRVKYHNEVPGYNSRLDEIQAAALRVKLRSLDEWNGRREQVAALYNKALAGVPIDLPQVREAAGHVWHLYVIRTRQRDELQAFLAQEGISTMIHYPVPPHLQPACADLHFGPGSFPLTEVIHEEVLSLPIGPHISLKEARRVAKSVVKFFKR